MTQLTPPPNISYPAIGKLALPIWVANMAIIGSSTIDTIMAGQLGKTDLAAISLGIATTISVLMAFVGILQGLSPIAGHHFGARQYSAIGDEVTQSFWLAVILSMIGMPIMLQTDFWTSFGGASGERARLAAEYITWTAYALPAALLDRVFISLNSAVSRPNVTMYVSLLTLALKAPCNAIFMYGWLGFPAMGGSGAGVSFFVLSWVSLLVYVILWLKDPFYKKMHPKHITGPRWALIKNHLHVGVPMGLCTFFEVSSFTLMAIFISRLGEVMASAHQVVANITSMLYMMPLSIGIATSVLVAQSLGARWPSIAKEVVHRALKLGLLLSGSFAILLYFGRQYIVPIYNNEVRVVTIAVALLFFGCTYCVSDSIQCISSFALRGYRVTRAPMIIYGVLLWGIGIGLGYYFSFHAEYFGGPYGATGFWACTAVGLILTSICLSAMAFWVSHQRAKDEEHTPEEIQKQLQAMHL